MMKCIYNPPSILGECPLWDNRDECLYWVDIEAEQIHCLNIESGDHKVWNMRGKPGSIALHGAGGLIVALSNQLVRFLPSTGDVRVIEGTQVSSHVRFNDGRCDAKGRFWVGSMDLLEKNPVGALYCLDDRQNFIQKDRNIIISNGLDWSPDSKVMYFTDSPRRIIYAYDFDLPSGGISGRREFAVIPQDAGYPDGLCVDEAGCVWSAHFMGARITRYTPDGKIDQVLEVPALCPTSCCFGGRDRDRLFITTATRDLTPEQCKNNLGNGGIFMFDVSLVRGKKETPYFLGARF